MKADISDEEWLTSVCIDFLKYGIQQNCVRLSISKGGISAHTKYIHQNLDINFSLFLQ
jgi:hypothetical protein